jgi:hypothetical protein
MSCAVAIIEEGTAAGKTPGAAVVAPRSEDVPAFASDLGRPLHWTT